MSEFDLDADLADTDRYLVSLSKRVEPDPRHKAVLRQELLRRHQELIAEESQRAARTLWFRFAGLKRLTLVAPPALAGILALILLMVDAQMSGHRSPQAAEAARISQALARTTRTVTAWQVTFQQQKGNSSLSAQCTLPLHLYPRDGKMYLYRDGQWFLVTPGAVSGLDCPSELRWIFATLPNRLAHNAFTLLPRKRIGGRVTEGIQYQVTQGGTTVTSTVWVDRQTGLVVRARRVAMQRGQVVERDNASYSYTRSA